MLRFAFVAMILLGFFFTYDGFNSASGTNCAAVCTTSTAVTSTSVSSTGPPSPFTLNVKAVDDNSNQLVAQFYIDSSSSSPQSTPATLTTLPQGQHTLTCLPLAGYNQVVGQVTITSQPGTMTSVTCSYSKSTTLLTVQTTDVYGTRLNGAIVLDGSTVGTGGVSLSIAAGQHTLSCGPVSGYITPATRTLNLAPGTYVTSCVYAATQGSPVTTLTVNVVVCDDSSCASYEAQTHLGVSLSNGQSGVTDAYGQAVFTVPVQSSYTIYVNSNYGQSSKTVAVGSAPATAIIQQCCTGGYFSIVGLSLFGNTAAGIASEILVGVALLVGGGAGFVLSSRKGKPGL